MSGWLFVCWFFGFCCYFVVCLFVCCFVCLYFLSFLFGWLFVCWLFVLCFFFVLFCHWFIRSFVCSVVFFVYFVVWLFVCLKKKQIFSSSIFQKDDYDNQQYVHIIVL